MYLSHLLIDVGNNPDRPRPGRLWLRHNIYHVHQRLCMAFPTPQQCATDPQFLRPFDPVGFERSRFLFRVDNNVKDNGPRAIVLVQSEQPPDWDYAFQNACMFLAAPPETKEYAPEFSSGERLRFRIQINLSMKIKKSQDGTDLRKLREGADKKGRQKEQGKRVAFTWDADQNPEDAIREWFASKGAQRGFVLHNFHLLHLAWVVGYRPKATAERQGSEEGRKMKFRSALLEGTLGVTDAEAFANAIYSGIGSGKAFGFGLLSVAPV